MSTNFPNGFGLQGVTIGNLPVNLAYSNKVFWVHNATGSDGNSGSFDKPFKTLDYAIGRCADGRGDVIMLKAGHAETITGVGGITADKSDISIIGLGAGPARPTFLMDGAATVTFAISAAGVTVQNCVFNAGHADIVTCFNITAAGASLIDVEFGDFAVNENWLTPIKCTSTTDNNADGLRVLGCRWLSPDAACTEFIEINADLKGLIVSRNVVVHEGTASPLVLFATGKDMKYGEITWNFLSHKMTANELFVSCDTTGVNNSGIIAHNRVGHADVTTAHDLGIDSLGARLFDNLSVSTNALSGLLLPAADVDS